MQFFKDAIKISIHAPAKGATCIAFCLWICLGISIHAPAKGATQVLSSLRPYLPVFQSTLPRRERQSVSRRAVDIIKISIHAPAKGATDTSLKIYPKITISIHAPAKGATKVHQMFCADIMNFNPRSREGSDSNIIQQISFSLYNTVYFVSNNIK